MTKEQTITISWRVVLFIVGVVFGAGVFYATMGNAVSNLKVDTYSHEDGKLLELKVQNLTVEVQTMNGTLNAIQQYMATGKWPRQFVQNH